jgi:hypothetical protein
MDRKNLLIACGLIGGSAVLLIMGIFIFNIITDPVNVDDLTVIPNSTNLSEEKNIYFDNSTPESTAISIARLNEGMIGFDGYITTTASLTSDGKYWIVKMHNVYDVGDELVFTVDAKTLMSKKNGWLGLPMNSWKSLDELKARYIAEIQSDQGIDIGTPSKVTLDGKTVWKVPFYNSDSWYQPYGYVYVDLTTGKSKFAYSAGGSEEWRTLKELDDSIYSGTQFRNALRNLYPE